jgi:sporulation protein YlmC with PRC-barrel domain
MNKFCRFSGAAVLAIAVPLAMSPPVFSQAVELVVVTAAPLTKGYRASKLTGASVYNDANEKVGTIDDIIIGQDSRALIAILQVGGFLGVGGKLVAVPYENLHLDSAGGKVVLPGANKDELKQVPEFKYT